MRLTVRGTMLGCAAVRVGCVEQRCVCCVALYVGGGVVEVVCAPCVEKVTAGGFEPPPED